uniref:Uncharacterized protein n=1 Tax=Lactuca sativa TaxID=4236 RepID=A0A9R1XJ97_LACSA|nr:hypothetical protein LSAT_V11C400189230 [Lactuca sativa]
MKDSSALFDLNVPFVYAINMFDHRNLNFSSLYTVHTLKEKLCYVAIDSKGELRKDTKASYEVPVEGLFTLKQKKIVHERFYSGHILQDYTVAICLEHCHAGGLTPDETWFKTIVLAGGTPCLPGVVGTLTYHCYCYVNKILLEITKFCDLYLMETVLDDESEVTRIIEAGVH